MITGLVLIVLCLVAAFAGLAVLSRLRAAGFEFRFERPGRDVEFDGGRLNVLELGDPRSEGPPIVLVHGSGANLLDLKISLGDRLARDRRVILIDRPGHGWSAPIDRDGIHTPEGQAIVLNQVLTRLGVIKPLVVGHDWGGALALSYALSYSEEVAGLVVIAPASHRSPRRTTLVHRLAATAYCGRALSEILAPSFGPVMQHAGLARSFAPQSLPADHMEAVAAPLELQPAAFHSNACDVVALDGFLDEQSAFYGQIRIPMVVICGDEDRVTRPSAHAEKLAREVHDSRLVILNDVGHMAHHATPNVIVFEINRLAERL